MVATSAPDIKIFSVDGSIITEQRSNIATENVDRMFFLYENMEVAKYFFSFYLFFFPKILAN